MRETHEKLIKKIEGKGYERALNFIEKRVKRVIPYNWKKYKYYIFDTQTPEYGLSIGYFNDDVINIIFDTATDYPVIFYLSGICIHVEDGIEKVLCARLHETFYPIQFASSSYIDPGYASNLAINSNLTHEWASYTIYEFGKRLYNILPPNRRRKTNIENDFKRLKKLSRQRYNVVGTDLLPFSRHLQWMYNDIL